MMHANTPAIVQFHGQEIVTLEHNSKRYVAMRPIAEAIGLQWEAQLKRIKRHPVLQSSMSMMDIQMPSDNQRREIVCLPLSMLNGWLFGVDVNRVKPEIKDRLIQYQRECFDALAAYWQQGEAINPRKAKPTTKALPNCLTVEQQKAIQTLVKSRAESIPDQSKWAGATIKQYSVLKSKFGVGYKEIPESQFSEALNIIARIVLDGEVINEKPQCFKPLKWSRIGDQHPNAKHAHTILSEIKRWLYHYDTPVARDLHDALTDVGRVITTATTEMQEAAVNLQIGMHYLNRFRK